MTTTITPRWMTYLVAAIALAVVLTAAIVLSTAKPGWTWNPPKLTLSMSACEPGGPTSRSILATVENVENSQTPGQLTSQPNLTWSATVLAYHAKATASVTVTGTGTYKLTVTLTWKSGGRVLDVRSATASIDYKPCPPPPTTTTTAPPPTTTTSTAPPTTVVTTTAPPTTKATTSTTKAVTTTTGPVVVCASDESGCTPPTLVTTPPQTNPTTTAPTTTAPKVEPLGQGGPEECPEGYTRNAVGTCSAPVTGTATVPLVLSGAALLGAGGGLMRWRRKRMSATI